MYLGDAEVDDELHVGIVVGVGAARHLDELVRATVNAGVNKRSEQEL